MGRGQISAVGQIDAYHLRESGFLRYHIFANKPAVAGLFGDPSEGVARDRDSLAERDEFEPSRDLVISQ